MVLVVLKNLWWYGKFLPNYIKLDKAFSKLFIAINFWTLLIKNNENRFGIVLHIHGCRSPIYWTELDDVCIMELLFAMFSPKGKATKKLSQGIDKINDFVFGIRRIWEMCWFFFVTSRCNFYGKLQLAILKSHYRPWLFPQK